jgi:hypothetical protein
VKVAVKEDFGAVKVSGGAVILAKSSREGLAGPGNPAHNRGAGVAPVCCL